MSKSAVLTKNAPPPLAGILSQAIIANGMVYCSGATGVDPATGKLVEGDIKARTVSCSSQRIQRVPLPLT
jgi:enamine deaminase RidA (YjgF/YER057c/UK114 family)